MKKFLLFLPVFAILFTSCEKPASVLLVTGGHRYDTTEFHDLFSNLEGVRCDTASHPRAMNVLRSDAAGRYDVLVFYDFIADMPLKDSSVYLKLTRQGVPMLFLHHSICTFQKWDGYMKMVGGRYYMPGFGHDSTLLSDYRHGIDMTISVADDTHPVTAGLEDFTIHDEGYSNLGVLPDVSPLLRTDHPDSSPLVGWVHSSDASDIIYLMLGHDRRAYEDPAFRQLVERSINWLATR